MTIYRAPLRDMRFVLHELPGYASLRGLPDRTELSTDVADSILDGAAKLAAEVLRPINRGGDEESCALDDGAVRTPRGFAKAFRSFADGGWAVVAAHPEFGGQHLPHTLQYRRPSGSVRGNRGGKRSLAVYCRATTVVNRSEPRRQRRRLDQHERRGRPDRL